MVFRSPEYADGTMDNIINKSKVKENKKIDIKYSLLVYLTQV